MSREELEGFIKKNKGRSKVETQKRIENSSFSPRDLIELRELCDIRIFLGKGAHLYNLKVAALKQAIEIASSLEDKEFIAKHKKMAHRKFK